MMLRRRRRASEKEEDENVGEQDVEEEYNDVNEDGPEKGITGKMTWRTRRCRMMMCRQRNMMMLRMTLRKVMKRLREMRWRMMFFAEDEVEDDQERER